MNFAAHTGHNPHQLSNNSQEQPATSTSRQMGGARGAQQAARSLFLKQGAARGWRQWGFGGVLRPPHCLLAVRRGYKDLLPFGYRHEAHDVMRHLVLMQGCAGVVRQEGLHPAGAFARRFDPCWVQPFYYQSCHRVPHSSPLVAVPSAHPSPALALSSASFFCWRTNQLMTPKLDRNIGTTAEVYQDGRVQHS